MGDGDIEMHCVSSGRNNMSISGLLHAIQHSSMDLIRIGREVFMDGEQWGEEYNIPS
jgi:hypothetical protein